MPFEIDHKIMETMQAKSLWEITHSDTFREYLKRLFSNLPPSVFDFDSPGDTAGFTGGYIRDDNDIAYGPLSVNHFQFAQYDKPFPLPMGTKPPYGTLIWLPPVKCKNESISPFFLPFVAVS